MNGDGLKRALQALGEVLADRGLRYELFVIGGGSLLLTGLVDRPTEDLDVVARSEGTRLVSAAPLPAGLVTAVEDVARVFKLRPDWLNAGPTDLLRFGLPSGFRERTRTESFGGLVLHHAGRFDQVCFKLYATVDQGPDSKHADDLRRLQPVRDELVEAARWCRQQDPSEPFRDQLRQALAWLGVDDVEP